MPIRAATAAVAVVSLGASVAPAPAVTAASTTVSLLTPTSEQVGLLAFTAPNPIYNRHEIYSIRTDGSRLVQLTTTGASEPAWSPDGAHIAYRHGAKVWLMNADGGSRQPLARGSEPAWSPDGQHLSYRCNDGGGLCVMELATRVETVPVASSNQWSGVGRSSWAPDGSTIVFTRYSVHGDDYTNYRSLWVVHPDGTGLAEVPNSGNQANDPAWSPDGNTIIYTTAMTAAAARGPATSSPSTPTALGRCNDHRVRPRGSRRLVRGWHPHRIAR